MKPIIERLDKPVDGNVGGHAIVFTHKAWGIRLFPWQQPPMQSVSVLGTMNDGQFVAAGGTEEYINFDKKRMASLRSMSPEAVRKAHLKYAAAVAAQ